MRTRSLRAAATAVLSLAAAAPAGAATVSMPFESHSPAYRDGPATDYFRFFLVTKPGETNRITIDGGFPARVRVTDTAALLSAGENCHPDGDGVVCSVSTGNVMTFPRPDIDLGDGHDELVVNDMSTSVLGGAGDDRISSPNHALTVDGGPGADFMRARSGGVTYASRTQGVTVTQDGVANDGEPGEGDDVGPTLDRVTGGEGDDELHAVDAPGFRTQLDGRGGDDRLFGGPEGDMLIGGDGDDSLLGGDGRDELEGGRGADLLRGGAGFDHVSFLGGFGVDVTLDDRPGDGGPGENDDAGSDIESVIGTANDDRIVGSDGPNTIQAGGGHDFVDGAGGADSLYSGAGSRLIGGPGSDYFQVSGDQNLIEARDGERDDIACGGTGNRYATDPFDVLIAIACTPWLINPTTFTVRARRDGSVRLAVRCTYGTLTDVPCAGKLYLYRRGDVGRGSPVGRARFELPAGSFAEKRVAMRLTRSARQELAAKRRLLVSVLWRTRNDTPVSSFSGKYDLKLLAPK